jgi:hypothetical protein
MTLHMPKSGLVCHYGRLDICRHQEVEGRIVGLRRVPAPPCACRLHEYVKAAEIYGYLIENPVHRGSISEVTFPPFRGSCKVFRRRRIVVYGYDLGTARCKPTYRRRTYPARRAANDNAQTLQTAYHTSSHYDVCSNTE